MRRLGEQRTTDAVPRNCWRRKKVNSVLKNGTKGRMTLEEIECQRQYARIEAEERKRSKSHAAISDTEQHLTSTPVRRQIRMLPEGTYGQHNRLGAPLVKTTQPQAWMDAPQQTLEKRKNQALPRRKVCQDGSTETCGSKMRTQHEHDTNIGRPESTLS
ncbi:hypothetical protein SKAU_G00095430 [Synaphobranchus kaupii]|uniref:Uncharacterized protein n=1 Tax=Synaphobranchus kaupii TaxID=118154 RepID=A0A9Q1FXI5_SYNKA|nr:hypothetical protein SKAU_G00095430 [Synaphobranchus kaupii]